MPDTYTLGNNLAERAIPPSEETDGKYVSDGCSDSLPWRRSPRARGDASLTPAQRARVSAALKKVILANLHSLLSPTIMSVPPGASYRFSNALIIAKRRLLNLEDPVRIQFQQAWDEDNPLFDWYSRRSSWLIESMQLRKEHESPFFHEYVVFKLRDSGGYFRIDRRQLPNEDVPLDCIYKDGVEAHDTIEEVTSFNDMLYCSSDCLVELEFKVNLHLGLVLRICRAIQQHPDAKVYTLQRYNCYFFAQTILACATRIVLQCSNPINKNVGNIDVSPPSLESFRAKGKCAAQISHGNSVASHFLDGRKRASLVFPSQMSEAATPLGILVQIRNQLINHGRPNRELTSDSPLGTTSSDDPTSPCRVCAHWSPDPVMSVDKLSKALGRAQSSLKEFWDKLLPSFAQAIAGHRRQLDSRRGGLWGEYQVIDLRELLPERVDSVARLLELSNYEPSTVKKRWLRFCSREIDQIVEALLNDPRVCCPDFDGPTTGSGLRKLEDSKTQLKALMVGEFDSRYQQLGPALREEITRLGCPFVLNQSEGWSDQCYVLRVFDTEGSRYLLLLDQSQKGDGGDIQPYEKSYRVMQEFILGLVEAHGARVEQYRMVLGCSAVEVQLSIQSAMNDVWLAIGQDNSYDSVDAKCFEVEEDPAEIPSSGDNTSVQWATVLN